MYIVNENKKEFLLIPAPLKKTGRFKSERKQYLLMQLRALYALTSESFSNLDNNMGQT